MSAMSNHSAMDKQGTFHNAVDIDSMERILHQQNLYCAEGRKHVRVMIRMSAKSACGM
jgi:hypothetical protein